jgi:hypothetical protein
MPVHVHGFPFADDCAVCQEQLATSEATVKQGWATEKWRSGNVEQGTDCVRVRTVHHPCKAKGCTRVIRWEKDTCWEH